MNSTPEPPARHRRKRAAWSSTNGTGRLVRKTSGSDLSIPGFKLHVGDFRGDLTVVQAFRSFTVSSDLLFAILRRPRPGQAAVFQDEGGIPRLSILPGRCRMPRTASWPIPAAGLLAGAPIPRTYTYLHDADHGWLIVSRADLDSAGLSPADFSTWTYVCGDTLALDEYGDMPKFLKRLDERGILTAFTTAARRAMPPFGIGSATPGLWLRQADRCCSPLPKAPPRHECGADAPTPSLATTTDRVVPARRPLRQRRGVPAAAVT